MAEMMCVGVDVSKETLDVATSEQAHWSFANDEPGIKALIDALKA